jgi:hypothetical protein
MSIENKPNEQQTGADIVVKTLEQQNVKWVFGVCGGLRCPRLYDPVSGADHLCAQAGI